MDPFLRATRLELERLYYPLGFPLHLKTNCAAILDAAAESWGGRAQAFERAPLDLRVLVEPGGAHPPEPVYRAQGCIMNIVSDAKNFCVSDYSRHFAYSWLSEAAAADHAFVRYWFLEALANFSLAQLYLTPLHGACVARDGRGVALCGASGAGKTSLAYFCARAGWTYVSDNESWLVRPAGTVLVGNPRQIRFREDARRLFPELNGLAARPHANGKLSIEVDPGKAIRVADRCELQRVVFLSREASGAAAIRAVPAHDVVERLLAEIPIYEESVRAEQRASLEKLAELGAVELRYSRLEDAARLLEGLLC